ncbi:MAG: peroxiredoxin [Candidatus Shapirobacteria bacterium]|nr:peroxiredoxin [Candidatus Shapirobacteria bacterium]
MKANNFELPDQNGKTHKLVDYLGKWVVLYFYPKDDTPGCTKEACSLRDNFRQIEKLGAVILGVSKDSVASHQKFAEKYNLNFTILSDISGKMIRSYGAKGLVGTLRKTYLIDDNGEIRKIYDKVNPTIHAEEIVDYLKKVK